MQVSRLFRSCGIIGYFAGILFWGAPARATDARPELVVYAYESWLARGGLGPDIIPLFEKKCACRVRAIPVGDGAQLVGRLELDAQRGKPLAHIVLGLDQNVWERARPRIEMWGKWLPEGYSLIPAELRVAPGFLPFDYGVLAFIADQKKLKEMKWDPPTRLSDLLLPHWRRNLLLQDPRTSTPGLAFVLYSATVLKSSTSVGAPGLEEFRTFWRALRYQWLALLPGWDQSYGLFLKGEAPLVWSYTTSQAYHEENGDRSGDGRRYRAILFQEGNPLQIEGAALVKGSLERPEIRKTAQSFLEFLISPEVQSRIPLKNWMFPVRKDVALPESFSRLPKVLKPITVPTAAAEVNRILRSWSEQVSQ